MSIHYDYKSFAQDKNAVKKLKKAWDRVLALPGLQEPLRSAGLKPDQIKRELEQFRVDDQQIAHWESEASPLLGFKRKPGSTYLDDRLVGIAHDYLRHRDPSRRGSKPPTRYIADANDAELAAAEFMRWLGFPDAQASPVGPDGGIDVSSKRAVGQVKDYGKPIGRPELQQHLGVAVGEGGKLPIFFARSGYTNQALEWANERYMPLYEFDLAGSWAPSNTAGELLWSAGADRFLKNRGLKGKQSPLEDIGDPPVRPRLEEQGAAGAQDVTSDSSEQEEEPAISSEESGAGLAAEIRALGDLRDSGVLDDEEFRLAKKKLLD